MERVKFAANTQDGVEIAYDRVEALGGRLQLESPAGVGTVVRVELPL